MMHLDCLPNQQRDEHVVLFLRRNWLTPLGIAVMTVLMIGLPIAIVSVLWEKISLWLSYPVLGPVITLFASIYFLSVWLFSFMEFTDYYLDTWIVTTERIMNVEQKGLFNRIASELHLAAVQDVTSLQTGIIGTFLDYGDVSIQTAAEKERFRFQKIDHPEKVKETIIRLIEEDKKRHAGSIIAAVAEGQKHADNTEVP